MFTDNVRYSVRLNSKWEVFYKLVHFINKALANYLTLEASFLNFIPPTSPYFGGLLEAVVKSVMNHLNLQDLTTYGLAIKNLQL